MDIEDIITEFGAYYIDGGQNMSRLVKQLYRPCETELLFTRKVTDDTKYRLSESTTSRLLQPFQKAWTPTGAAGFVPRTIDQFQMKVDFEDNISELEASWLGFLAGDDIDRAQWPFVRWFMEQHMLPKIQEDKEENEIFAGEYAAPTPGTPGAAGTAMNGIKLIINTLIDEGSITPITTGALATDGEDFVEQIEAFCDAINTRYWKQQMKLAMSEEKARLYFRGYRAKYGKDSDFSGEKMIVSGTNIEVKGLPSMVGSEKIWCTPADNAILLQKKTQNQKMFRVESLKRDIFLFTDFWFGVGFAIPQCVFTNDNDLLDD